MQFLKADNSQVVRFMTLGIFYYVGQFVSYTRQRICFHILNRSGISFSWPGELNKVTAWASSANVLRNYMYVRVHFKTEFTNFTYTSLFSDTLTSLSCDSLNKCSGAVHLIGRRPCNMNKKKGHQGYGHLTLWSRMERSRLEPLPGSFCYGQDRKWPFPACSWDGYWWIAKKTWQNAGERGTYDGPVKKIYRRTKIRTIKISLEV